VIETRETPAETVPRPVAPSPFLVLWSALRRYYLTVAVAVVGGVLFGGFYAVLRPNEYQSQGKLIVRPGSRDTVNAQSAIAGGAPASLGGTRDLVSQEMHILVSPDLFGLAAKAIGADRVLSPYDPFAEDTPDTSLPVRLLHRFQSWWYASGDNTGDMNPAQLQSLAASVLSRTVQITPEPNSGVITVSYGAGSPVLAQQVVEKVLQAAREVHKRVNDNASELQALQSVIDNEEQTARGADAALSAFKIEKGIYDFDAQRTSLLATLAEIEKQIESTAVEMALRAAERTQLVKQREGDITDAPTSTTSIVNPEYTALAEQLTALITQQIQLEAVLGASPESLQLRRENLDARIAQIRGKLQETALILELETKDVTRLRSFRLTQDIDVADVALQGLSKRKEELETSLGSVKAKLGDFEKMTSQYRKLELDAEQSRGAADRMKAVADNLRSLQRLDQQNLSNLQILHSATFSPRKIGPRRSMLVILGAILGLFAGVAIALARMLADPIVRTTIDLRRLGVDVHGVLASSSRGARSLAELPVSLRAAFADAKDPIATLWSRLPYDRRAREGLLLAFVPDAQGHDASRVAGCFAVGLALHGGERTAYVSCRAVAGWLEQRLALPAAVGWTDVLEGKADIAAALRETIVPGMSFLGLGTGSTTSPHPMRRTEFTALLDRLAETHAFVIVDLPGFQVQPEGPAVLRAVDAVILATHADLSTKAGVRNVLEAAEVAGAQVAGGVLVADERTTPLADQAEDDELLEP
jgi:uncharacterized protein involved in exopolysaccharide biosynthesis